MTEFCLLSSQNVSYGKQTPITKHFYCPHSVNKSYLLHDIHKLI